MCTGEQDIPSGPWRRIPLEFEGWAQFGWCRGLLGGLEESTYWIDGFTSVMFVHDEEYVEFEILSPGL